MSGNRPALPGDLPASEAVERIIRVDHAGEYGASRIYAGQLAVLGRGPQGDLIRHMKSQEEVHLQTFARLVGARRVRPTALLPLWNLAGFALGAVTAAMGSRAAMACTVAVEETIDEHYAVQADVLGPNEAAFRETIERFRADEMKHREIGLENEALLAPGYRVMSAVIKAGCKIAIAISERL